MTATTPRTVLVYAPVKDVSLFETVGFYRQDIEALERLGYEVTTTNSLRVASTTRTDLVWIWWWTYALPPILIQRFIRRTTTVVTGVFNYEGMAGSTYSDRPLWQRLMMRAAARLATYNVFLSHRERDLLNEKFDLPPERSSVVPLEVDADFADDAPPLASRDDFFLQLAWSGEANLRRKCVYETIRALEIHCADGTEAELIIAGNEGDGRAALEARCLDVEEGLTVRYLGFVSEERKLELLRSCRAYISPSKFEGFGLAIAEAMATGAPTVTSLVGAIPEVCGDHAEYCDGGDPESIHAALGRLLTSDDLADRTAAGRARILSRFGPGTRQSGIETVLELLSSVRPPR